jgi:hypothetical protein
MTTVKVQYAKTHLSALLARVEDGEEIVNRSGVTAGRQNWCRCADPVSATWVSSTCTSLRACFFEPLPEDELATWEADEGRKP